MTVRGEPHGYLSATLVPLGRVPGDNAAVTLRLALDPKPAPSGTPWDAILAAIAALGLVLLGIRFRPWRWRLVMT